jgi:protein involved in polysaccharide export with SLBB domain
MMLTSPDFNSVVTAAPRRHQGRASRFAIVLSAWLTILPMQSAVFGQTPAGLLTSRDELTVAAIQAEQSGKPLEAAAIRQRLHDGDFQVGDRIVLTIVSDARHTDTLVVRPGKLIDLPGKTVVPLTGVLRSELKDRVTVEVLKYVRAQEQEIDVTPLTRIAVLGEVARPGYFAFRSDVPITDAIMLAGGPTASAAIDKTVVKRESRQYRSAKETQDAVTKGLTLDQFGLSAGDELVVGRQREWGKSIMAVSGIITSIGAIFLIARR